MKNIVLIDTSIKIYNIQYIIGQIVRKFIFIALLLLYYYRVIQCAKFAIMIYSILCIQI